MKEYEFFDLIDACFPFDDEKKSKRLVAIGSKLSDNAALMVGLELALGRRKYRAFRLELLKQLLDERPTEAVQTVAPVIKALIRNETVPVTAKERLLDYCKKTSDCYNALNILFTTNENYDAVVNDLIMNWRHHKIAKSSHQ